MSTPAYKRVLLKLSGEALMGDDAYGINRATIERMVADVSDIAAMGIEVAIVIGGGNIFRGVAPGAQGMDRATADYMGMLATVMNSLALADAMRQRVDHGRQLALHDMLGLPGFTLGQRLADADHRRDAVGQRRLGLVGHELIAFLVIGAALRMAHEGVTAAEVRQHARRHFAGVGALLMSGAILGAITDLRAGQGQRGLGDVGERHAHGHIRRPGAGVLQAAQQQGVGRPVAMHLPVADDQLLAHELPRGPHQTRTILPTCSPDSIRAWAAAAWSAGSC